MTENKLVFDAATAVFWYLVHPFSLTAEDDTLPKHSGTG